MNQERSDRLRISEGAGKTALIIAQARAAESARPDRLIDDPFARQFVHAAGAGFSPEAEGIASLLRLRGDYIAIRTRFFDDYLLDACQAGCRQVVLLAAGLDARAFRLAWPPEVELFEVDLPEVLAFKGHVLAAMSATAFCRRVTVPADLRGDWPRALVTAGFRSEVPTAWLLEGILMYLNEDERDRLLDRVTALSAPGSHLGLDHRGIAAQDGRRAGNSSPAQSPNQDREAYRDTDADAAHLGVRIPGRQAEASEAAPEAWLNWHGWDAQVYNAVERFRFHGRQVEATVEEAAAQLWLARAPTSLVRRVP
jgi:methyltransferase (TIGR00027 family)